jgi:cell cycle related kinase
MMQVIRGNGLPLTEAQVKSYMLMLLKGVDYCHDHNIMHRVHAISMLALMKFS